MDKDDIAVKELQDGAAHSEHTTEVENDADDASASAQLEPGSEEWYEAKIKKLETERDNYKTGLLNEKDKNKNDGSKGLSEEAVARLLDEKLQEVKQSFATNFVEQELAYLNLPDNKREYVRKIYETRIKSTGSDVLSVRRDVSDALAIVEREAMAKENSELKTAHANRSHGYAGSASGTHQGRQGSDPKFFSKEQEAKLNELSQKYGIEIKPEEVEKNLKKMPHAS